MQSVPCHLLVIEDNPSILELLTLLLEGEGYAVRATAERAAIAVQGDQPSPDLLLLGIGFRDRQSWELLHDLRQTAGPALPVVVLSTVPQDAQRARAAGAAAFIAMPFDINHLLEVVARLTHHSE